MPEKDTLNAFRNLVVGAQHGKVQVSATTSEVGDALRYIPYCD